MTDSGDGGIFETSGYTQWVKGKPPFANHTIEQPAGSSAMVRLKVRVLWHASVMLLRINSLRAPFSLLPWRHCSPFLPIL